MLWFLVGLIAGFLDYAFALGFGLISSIILVGLIGFDVKDVVPIVTLAQVITSLPAFLLHLRYGNVKSKPPRELLSFVLLSSLFAFLIPPLVTATPPDVRRLLYVLTLITLPIAIRIRKRSVLLYSALAGLDKAVVGGGLSLIIVSMELSLGIDIRTAIALMPLIKLIPTISTTFSYMFITNVNFVNAVYMSVGALIASLFASKTLKRIEVNDAILLILVSLVVLFEIIKLLIIR